MSFVPSSLKVGWLQVSHSKTKLIVASSGVVVAVMLMFVQLGIRRGAIDSTIAVARRMTADVVIVSPRTKSIFKPSPFPRSLLYRAAGHSDVKHLQCMYFGTARFRNPWTHQVFPISVYGLEADEPMMQIPGYRELRDDLQLADRVSFDVQSRPTYGPIAAELQAGREPVAEVNHRRVHLVGTVSVGVSLGVDGTLYVSPANFSRLFPERSLSAVDIGLVRLKEHVEPEAVAEELEELLGSEARVMSYDALVDSEEEYLLTTEPLDFIFGMGAVVGFFIGFVVVYQILYSEVANHLPHYATLKAMGFHQSFLLRLVLSQAVVFSIIGFIPGFLLALGIYALATDAIQMPVLMTIDRALLVFLTTLAMCGLSGLIAIRRLASAQPADVF